jgi:hypothetical protein
MHLSSGPSTSIQYPLFLLSAQSSQEAFSAFPLPFRPVSSTKDYDNPSRRAVIRIPLPLLRPWHYADPLSPSGLQAGMVGPLLGVLSQRPAFSLLSPHHY